MKNTVKKYIKPKVGYAFKIPYENGNCDWVNGYVKEPRAKDKRAYALVIGGFDDAVLYRTKKEIDTMTKVIHSSRDVEIVRLFFWGSVNYRKVIKKD